MSQRDARPPGANRGVRGCWRDPPGVSADSPFAQGAFKEEHGLEFDLVSDMAGDAIRAYDVEMDIPDLGLYGNANRSVFVVDEDGTISYSWIADDPTNEPPYVEILDAVGA